MNKRRIKISVILGILAIVAIISFQYLWFKEVFDEEKRKFNQSVHIALLEVAKLIVSNNSSQLPHSNPVEKISEGFYLVKIIDEIDADILEFYLKNEFEKFNIKSDFEYAIYDCRTEEMVYGDYVSWDDPHEQLNRSTFFPKIEGLVYYFAVKFPNEVNFISGPTRIWTIIAIISLVVLIVYLHSLFIILKQNQYYELQKDFINNMTHEFKTPLSSIMIASGYLKDNEWVKKDERLSRYSAAIQLQTERLNQHVEKILSLAKSDTSSFALDKNPFNIIRSLKQVIENFQLKHGENVDLELHCENEAIHVIADEVHFMNVIYNFLDNAHKYSRQPAFIKVKVTCPPGKVVILISDQGIGIAKKHLKKIFYKFYRIPKKDAETVNGFGLGLYYAKKICSLHRWKLEMDSSPFEGTNVNLTIPLP